MDGQTRVMFGQISSLRKPYAIRIYLLLASFARQGHVRYSLSEFRRRLHCTDRLLRYAAFKKTVLTPSILAINESDTSEFTVIFDDKYGRAGREVRYLTFTLVPRKGQNQFANGALPVVDTSLPIPSSLPWRQARLQADHCLDLAIDVTSTAVYQTHRADFVKILMQFAGKEIAQADDRTIIKELGRLLRQPACVKALWDPYLKAAGLYPNGYTPKSRSKKKLQPNHYMRITSMPETPDLFKEMDDEVLLQRNIKAQVEDQMPSDELEMEMRLKKKQPIRRRPAEDVEDVIDYPVKGKSV